MTITKQQALAGIASGKMYYDGMASGGHAWPDYPHYWIISDCEHLTVHHVAISDNEDMIGCAACGRIVEPEPDARGCHCPACKATL